MEVKYCPYCGTKLMETARFCDNCGSEISFTSEGSLDNDNFEEEFLERMAPRIGRRYFYLSFISTIICFLFITLGIFLSAIPGSILVMLQVLIYESMAANLVFIVLAFRLNSRLAKKGFNSLGPCNATMWVGLFGLAFGVVFIFAVLMNFLNVAGTNPDSTALNNLLSVIIK